MFSRIGIIFYASSVERENSRLHNKYYDGSFGFVPVLFSILYIRLAFSFSLLFIFFLLWPRSEHFRSAVLCREHKIKMYFVRHNYVKWKYVCVLVSAIKSINSSAEKFFDANANRVIGRQSHHYFDLTRFEFVDCIGYWNVIFTDFITLENSMVKLISLSAPVAYWWFYSDAFYVRISQIFRPNIQIFIFKIWKRRESSAVIEFNFK